MDKKKQTLLNVLAYVMTPFIVGVGNIFKIQVFINELGSLQNGMYQFYFALLIYFTIAEQSMDMALYKPLYQYIVGNKQEKINALIAGARSYWVRFGLAYLGLGLISLPLAPMLIGNQPSVMFVLIMHVLYTLRGVVPYWFFGPRTLALADNRGYLVVSFNSAMTLVSTIGSIVIVYTTHNLLYAVFFELIATCLFVFVEYVYLLRVFPFLNMSYRKKKSFEFQQFLPSTLTTKITDIVINNSDIFIVTVLFGATVNSTFAIFVSFSAILISLFGLSVMSSVQSLLGKYFAEMRYDKKSQQQSVRLLKAVNYMIIAIVVPLITLALNPFIGWFYGLEQKADAMFYFVLIVFIYVRLFRTPYATLKISTGHYETFVPFAIADALLKLVLSFVFGRLLGVSGVLLGTIVAYIVTELWLEAREFDIKMLQETWVRYIVEVVVHFTLTVVLSMMLYTWIAPFITDFWSLMFICTLVGLTLSLLVIGIGTGLSRGLRVFIGQVFHRKPKA